jgi:septum formation protein
MVVLHVITKLSCSTLKNTYGVGMSDEQAFNILLASASSRRLEMLRQINVFPAQIVPADIDETPQKGEKPKNLAERLSQQKAKAVFDQNPDFFVLAADTVVSCGQKVLDKAENEQQARKYLKILSGRRHRVYGGITLITPEKRTFTRNCETLVQFKPLSDQEIEAYIASGEWEGKAGGYAIQGIAGSYIKYIAGSYSNVVGLSLYDTMKILESSGLDIQPLNRS